jgi:elongation factor 1-gamma
LNDHLKTNTHLVGNRLSIADIAFVSNLFIAFKVSLDEKFRKSIPNVLKWFESVAANPSFVKYFGKVYYVTKDWEPFQGTE